MYAQCLGLSDFKGSQTATRERETEREKESERSTRAMPVYLGSILVLYNYPSIHPSIHAQCKHMNLACYDGGRLMIL